MSVHIADQPALDQAARSVNHAETLGFVADSDATTEAALLTAIDNNAVQAKKHIGDTVFVPDYKRAVEFLVDAGADPTDEDLDTLRAPGSGAGTNAVGNFI